METGSYGLGSAVRADMLAVELKDEAIKQLTSLITNDVQPFVIKGVTQGIINADLELDLAAEVFDRIMAQLKLADVRNPFKTRKYRVEVAFNTYDTLLVIDDWESEDDLTESDVFDEIEIDVPEEIRFELSLKGKTTRGDYALDGVEDQIRDYLTIEITENE